MSFQTWLAFSIAAGIVLAIPGPTVIAVVSHSLAHGLAALRLFLSLSVATGCLDMI